jgi:hypothetical protein
MRNAEMIGASATKLHFGASEFGTWRIETLHHKNVEVPKREIVKALYG